MILKKGAKVIIHKDMVFAIPQMNYFRGKCVTIDSYCGFNNGVLYLIKEDDRSNFWTTEMFEPLFSKANLEDGMVVEFNNGIKGMLLGSTVFGMRNFEDLNNFDDFLVYKTDENFYIKKIYKSKAKVLLSYLDKSNLELIWEREEKKPEYYNGKVVCLDTGDIPYYTKGKIYEFKNGIYVNDYGVSNKEYPMTTFEKFQDLSDAEWLEVKE